jgi:Fic family protein
MAKTSTDTALRDIKDLVEKGIVQQSEERGRNTNYKLVDFKSE